MIINILYRFKNYPYLVVDDNKTIWELPNCVNKRTNNLRKLTFYDKRNAYRYNNQYLTKKRLYTLMYEVREIFGTEIKNTPF